MRAALSWALEQQEAELGLRLAGALWHFWEAHGHYSEGKRWLEESLAQEIRTSADARAKALEGLSWFTYRRGDTGEKEIAALVARRLTSRQIASRLVVSERTVDNHVANILKKLSLHSREQIAARMLDQPPGRG